MEPESGPRKEKKCVSACQGNSSEHLWQFKGSPTDTPAMHFAAFH